MPLIVALIVVGIIAVNAFKQIQGPGFDATARVVVTPNTLTSLITGTQPSFIDPARTQQTALGIAESDEVYAEAEKLSDGEFGDAESLQDATRVSADPNSDLISFTATSSDDAKSVGIANSVVRGYIAFRNSLAAEQIASTVDGLQRALKTLPADSPRREQVEDTLASLQALEDNAGDTQLVESASSAVQTTPSPLRDSIVGFSIGLILALVVVAVREAVDTTIRSEGEVEDLLSLPVLASVKTLPRNQQIVAYGRHEAEFADAYALIAAQLGDPGGNGTGTVLAVTSALPKEGKSSTSANLAIAFARRGVNVVLADFDFRKPGLAETFGLQPNAQGALQVMSGRADLDATLWSITQFSSRLKATIRDGLPEPARFETSRVGASHGSLRVLPAGGTVRVAPTEEHLKALINRLRREVDLVILDTPPSLLTVEVAELSKMVDSILLVARRGHVSERNLKALKRQLRTWPADVVGVVMTDVKGERKYNYYGDG